MKIEMIRNTTNNLPLKEIKTGLLMDFWEKYMQTMGPDICCIRVFKTTGGEEEVQHHMLPPTYKLDLERKRELLAKLNKLTETMREQLPKATQKVKTTHKFYDYSDEEDGFVVLYGKCRDGIIAIGWANDGDLHKGKTMAAFAMYALAVTNAESDEILYDAGAVHLPYRDGRLNLDYCHKLFLDHGLLKTPNLNNN